MKITTSDRMLHYTILFGSFLPLHSLRACLYHFVSITHEYFQIVTVVGLTANFS